MNSEYFHGSFCKSKGWSCAERLNAVDEFGEVLRTLARGLRKSKQKSEEKFVFELKKMSKPNVPSVMIVESGNGNVFIVENKDEKSLIEKILNKEIKIETPEESSNCDFEPLK